MNAMTTKPPIARPNELDIISERLLDAPRELVWEVWTNPKHVNAWWGPRGFHNTLKEMSVKPGGIWRFDMTATADWHGKGQLFPNKITFLEVKKPERIVFSHGDDSANPDLFVTTVLFETVGKKTRVTFSAQFSSVELRDRLIKENGALEGNVGTLDKMEEYVARVMAEEIGAPLEITRVFEAPRSLVWKALSEPARLAKWWGPTGFEMKAQKMEFKAGGTYHYSMTSPGQEMWGLFRYREIAPEHRILFTNSFADAQGNIVRAPFSVGWPLEVLNEQTLTEEAKNRTRLRLYGFPVDATADERKAFKEMHASMQGGFGATFDNLDAYLKSTQQN